MIRLSEFRFTGLVNKPLSAGGEQRDEAQSPLPIRTEVGPPPPPPLQELPATPWLQTRGRPGTTTGIKAGEPGSPPNLRSLRWTQARVRVGPDKKNAGLARVVDLETIGGCGAAECSLPKHEAQPPSGSTLHSDGESISDQDAADHRDGIRRESF